MVVNFFGFNIVNSVLYSYSLSFSFLIVAAALPLLTGIADASGLKKTFMKIFTYAGGIACIALFWFTGENVEFGIIAAVIASISFSGSLVFYNSFLPEIVSFDRYFDYEKLQTACRLIGNGARFIATNPDQALKTEQGLCPGTGAIVAAVAAGSGAEPVMIGKPERLIIEMALKRFDGVPRESIIAVGDNLATDIQAGERAGLRTALILTGVSGREDLESAPYQPTWVVENYAELEQIVFDHQ